MAVGLRYRYQKIRALKPAKPHDQTEKRDMEVCRLESRLMALENEQKKIDAFKRELPLCMQLLCEAIEASKEQLSLHHSLSHKHSKRPVTCSFDNRTSDVQSDNAGSEPFAKGKLLNSAYANSNEGEHSLKKHCSYVIGNDAFQWINIWTPRAELSSGHLKGNWSSVKGEERAQLYMYEQTLSSSGTPNVCTKQKLGGAFAPFSRNSQLVQPTPRPGAINPADLSIKCTDSGIARPPHSCRSVQKKAELRVGLELSICTKPENSRQQVKEIAPKERKTESDASNGMQLSQQRKTRRSWSPDLHQLFVDALQRLGGAQATPKQIRDLMKVEGLTNDEVKSHLQKYRLHSKKLRSSPTSASRTPCVIPVVRAWTPSADYASHSCNTTSRQSQSCETFETQENATELGSSSQLPLLVSRCNCMKGFPRHLQQYVGSQSARCFRLSDVGGEESVGEAVKPRISGTKCHYHPGVQLHEPDEIGDHSSNDNRTYSFGEDDKDYQDSPNDL